MNSDPQSGGTVFSMSYDMERQAAIQAQMMDNGDMDVTDHDSHHDEMQKAIEASYATLMGRSRVEVNLNKDGMAIESTITFK